MIEDSDRAADTKRGNRGIGIRRRIDESMILRLGFIVGIAMFSTILVLVGIIETHSETSSLWLWWIIAGVFFFVLLMMLFTFLMMRYERRQMG